MNAFLLRSVKMTLWLLAGIAVFAGVTWFGTHLPVKWSELWPRTKFHLSIENLLRAGLGFLGAVVALFWSWNDNFRKQWFYCCDLYNDCLKERDPILRDLMSNALAIDLIVVDLWAHRSFSELFHLELEAAVSELYQNEPGRRAEVLQRMKSGQLTEDTARGFLERYQEILLDRRKKRDESTVPLMSVKI